MVSDASKVEAGIPDPTELIAEALVVVPTELVAETLVAVPTELVAETIGGGSERSGRGNNWWRFRQNWLRKHW
jgi:hypothetical protein